MSRPRKSKKSSPRAADKREPANVRPRARGYHPLSSAEMPRYAGSSSFLRLPLVDGPDVPERLDVVICGAPFDGGTSFRPGARLGPRAVRDASALARRYSLALGVDIYDQLRVADGGDVPTAPHDIEPALAAIAARAEAIARSGVVGGFIGGDQTVTLGVLRGIHRAKLKPVGLVHIDAHANTSGPAWGRDVHHGSVIRNAVEEGLIRPDHSIQIGLRGPYSSGDDRGYSLSHGFEIVNIDEVKWDLHAAVSSLRRVLRQGPVYVSVDVTALDPAYAPGTGIPTPGGMSSWELQQLLRALVGNELVGFDVVEIAPAYDHANLTALVGVTVVQEILSALADTRRSTSPSPSTKSSGRRGRVSA